MARRLAILGLLAAVAAAQDVPLRLVYHHAKRLHGEHKTRFSADKAAEYEGKAEGTDLLYLAYLWRFAKEPAKAAGAFRAYLDEAGRAAKNRDIAMLERALALADLRRWEEVGPQAAEFAQEFPSSGLLGRMRFLLGRARRARADLEGARRAFEGAAGVGYAPARLEVADCLVQLGQLELAKLRLDGLATTAAVALRRALPRLGKPLPKLAVGHWAGKPPASAAVATRPTVFVFWSMKATRVKERVHVMGNALAAGDALVIGPTVYQQFDPARMRTDIELSPREEEGFVTGWHKDYALRYPLAVLDDSALFDLCGIDPVRPPLPAFAVGDSKGRFRYLRVGAGDWSLEAVQSMLRVVQAE